MKHVALLVVLLVAAVTSYAIGFQLGVVLLLIVGGVFELTFWALALRGGRRNGAA